MGALSGVAAAASSPSVSTGRASDIKDASAVLDGTVNPDGASTTYWFVWGLTPSYGSTSAKQNAGSGTVGISVRVTAGKLLPGTKYYYRLYAQNRYGLSAGAGRSFTTAGHPPPGVITGVATSITSSSAMLTGTLTSNKQSTRWEFQYGLNANAYTTTTTGGTVPAGSQPVAVSEPVSGLEAGTTFHYRLIAVHSGSATSVGADQTFTTLPSVRPSPHSRVSTRPRRDNKSPFVFTTSGKIGPWSSFPISVQCNGLVAIRYYAGRRAVALRFATLQSNCTFSEQVHFTHTFASKPGKQRPKAQLLRITIHFRGNSYLAPKSARDEHVRLG
jgi:phosphodiesterase/alkaline phosphatase D-like protein